jgi:hypothetical protein
MKSRLFFATMLALLVGLFAVIPVAFAAGTNTDWATFDCAKWVKGAGTNGTYGLVTTSNASNCPDGGLNLKAIPGNIANPNNIYALSFDFNPNQAGPSVGSPRMVILFSDNGNADLRPLTWTANTWTHLDGMVGNNWDNNGGCGFLYGTTWTAVKACHPGATITGIFMVNDSGYAGGPYPNGEQVTLDNITVNNITATGPNNNTH